MSDHKVADVVLAYPCFGIYADYDANAPDTETYFVVATKELAEEVCAKLNENPRKWGNLGFVDGWEHAKSFSSRPELREDATTIATNLETAWVNVEEDEDDGDDDED